MKTAPKAPAMPAPGEPGPGPSAEPSVPLHGPVDVVDDSLEGLQAAFRALSVEEVDTNLVKRKREREKDARKIMADKGVDHEDAPTSESTFEGAPSASVLHASASPTTTTLPASSNTAPQRAEQASTPWQHKPAEGTTHKPGGGGGRTRRRKPAGAQNREGRERTTTTPQSNKENTKAHDNTRRHQTRRNTAQNSTARRSTRRHQPKRRGQRQRETANGTTDERTTQQGTRTPTQHGAAKHRPPHTTAHNQPQHHRPRRGAPQTTSNRRGGGGGGGGGRHQREPRGKEKPNQTGAKAKGMEKTRHKQEDKGKRAAGANTRETRPGGGGGGGKRKYQQTAKQRKATTRDRGNKGAGDNQPGRAYPGGGGGAQPLAGGEHQEAKGGAEDNKRRCGVGGGAQQQAATHTSARPGTAQTRASKGPRAAGRRHQRNNHKEWRTARAREAGPSDPARTKGWRTTRTREAGPSVPARKTPQTGNTRQRRPYGGGDNNTPTKHAEHPAGYNTTNQNPNTPTQQAPSRGGPRTSTARPNKGGGAHQHSTDPSHAHTTGNKHPTTPAVGRRRQQRTNKTS